MNIALTIVFEKVDDLYMATVAELPGAISLGATKEEARENLQEAIELILEDNRLAAEEEAQGREIFAERIYLQAA